MNSHLLRFDKTKKITIFDLETFNLCLNWLHNRPWQVSWLTLIGNDVIDFQDHYVKFKNCDLSISEGAAKATKFDLSLFESKAVDSDIVFPKFQEVLESSDRLIAHNGLGFDIFIVRGWYNSKGLKWKHLLSKIIDTNCIARGIKLGIPFKQGDNFLEYQYRTMFKKQKGVKTNLTALGRENKIEHDYENLHNASVDIGLNRKIWDLLKFQIEI